MHRLIVVPVLLSALATGCASTTVIRSSPSGATVRDVRGQKVGKTPFTYSGTGVINSTDTFILEKPGYEETAVTVRRDQVNGLAIAGWTVGALLTSWSVVGLGLAAGILWSADYAPAYSVDLDPAPTLAQPEPVPPAAPQPQWPPAASARAK